MSTTHHSVRNFLEHHPGTQPFCSARRVPLQVGLQVGPCGFCAELCAETSRTSGLAERLDADVVTADTSWGDDGRIRQIR